MKTDKELRERAIELLKLRGVSITEVAQIVYDTQAKYMDDLTIGDCEESIHAVLEKREVQNTIITGIELDMLAEKKQLSHPLQEILMEDEGLYGLDEVLALSIVNLYGSIGYTNFGYLDKEKPGIIDKLNVKDGISCNTFLDDIVGALAAAAMSRLAHNKLKETE